MKWWKSQDERGNRGPNDWNDPTLPAGLVVCHGTEVVGGIGVTGGTSNVSNEELADIAIGVLGEGFRHRVDGDPYGS